MDILTPITTKNPAWNPKYDLNGDGKVDQADFDLFKSVYGAYKPTEGLALAADFTGNRVVDLSDFSEMGVWYSNALRTEPVAPSVNWHMVTVLALLGLVLFGGKK